MSAAEVKSALEQLAGSLAAQGHHLQAIKCYTAILGQSLLPADEAATRLKLAQLLLEHTTNVADAKQHLQKAELLLSSSPGQALLKCEVLAHLGRAHKHLGEIAFQRQCYLKGLAVCKEQTNASRRAVAEWGIYFHMHAAESYTAEGNPIKAQECAEAGAELAREQGMLEQQLLCMMFKLQLIMLTWDRKEAEQAVAAAAALLKQLEQPGGSTAPSFVAMLKLQFTVLQVILSIHAGNFQDLCPPDASPPPIITDMEGQLEALLLQEAAPYRWLAPTVLAALVQLLAAVIVKPGGKVKQAQEHICRGLQLVDQQLSALHVGPSTTESGLDHINTYDARPCLVLRILLLEQQQQLNLLSSNFAAACKDACDGVALLQRFPSLLAQMRPSVHLAAALYAQAVGAFDAAQRHFSKVALSSDSHMQVCGRCLAAMCCMAQGASDAVSRGRELLGELSSGVDSSLSYAERAVAHVAKGLLELAAPDGSQQDRSDAKQQLSKALKLAHGRLQNHQLVSQVLLFMTPLQVSSADSQGALQMVTSSFTLAKGAGDLHAQVASLSMMQQLYHHSRQPEKAAQNHNYLLRKQEELSGKIQAADSQAQQHMQVLGWDL